MARRGHFKDKCPKPPKSNGEGKKDDSPSKKPSGSANAVIDSDADSDCVLAIDIETESVISQDSMPQLQAVSDSDDDDLDDRDDHDSTQEYGAGDWFSDVGSDGGRLRRRGLGCCV